MLSTTAERILTSRYGRVMSYARLTACTDVKSRGESLTRFVKINSKRLPLKRVNMYSALVCPRSLLVAVLMLIERKIAKPIERLHFLFRSDCHIMRRLVIVSVPLSPLLPLVSSTCRSLSMTNSPLRSSRRCAGLSNLISRSCHSSCGACIVVCPPAKDEDSLTRTRPVLSAEPPCPWRAREVQAFLKPTSQGILVS